MIKAEQKDDKIKVDLTGSEEDLFIEFRHIFKDLAEALNMSSSELLQMLSACEVLEQECRKSNFKLYTNEENDNEKTN